LFTRTPIQLQQPRTGALQPSEKFFEQRQDEWVPERRVVCGEPAEVIRVQLRRGGRFYRRGREVPPVWGHKPRQAEHVSRSKRLHNDRSAAGNVRAELNMANTEEPTSSSMLVFLEYRDPGVDTHLPCRRCNRGALGRSEAIEWQESDQRAGRGHDDPAAGVVSGSANPASLAASSVMSIPTGHHAMHRPQPTQPDCPNWSYQVPNLWEIQWR